MGSLNKTSWPADFHLKALAASVADPGFLYVGLLFWVVLSFFWEFNFCVFLKGLESLKLKA